MNETAVIDYIVNWIKSYVNSTNGKIKSLIIGVSGGIDSALVSTLCAMTGFKTIVLTIPIKNSDMTLANKHCNFLTENFTNVSHHNIDLTTVYNKFEESCAKSNFTEPLGFANSKSRLRMTMLYQSAASESGIVVGTGNKVEDFGVGFYTKYGDGGVDISPIADLLKSEVRMLAKNLNIIDEIIKAKPTDGLWEDKRSDEDQLGMTYDEIEDAMLRIESKSFEKYQKIRNQNIHKMEPIPICMIDEKLKTSSSD
tara:strand:+ start:180 stop:941 length:762 start_codon:yes stop_codon:yes gene_type:complete